MGDSVGGFMLDSLAAYRLTRLVTTDTISDPVRDYLVGHPVFGYVGEGIECDWCVGVWVGGGVVLARAYAPGVWRAARWGLAVAAVVGWVRSRESLEP